MDAFVAVLISQPLRLACHSIDGDFLWESCFIGLVLRSTILEPNAAERDLRLEFHHLETVSLRNSRSWIRFNNNASNTADLLPVFYLPSIKQISASIDNPITFSWPAILPPPPSSLRNLKLENIREPFLRQILLITNQLLSLHWEWYYTGAIYGQPYHLRIIDLTEITKSISYVRKT